MKLNHSSHRLRNLKSFLGNQETLFVAKASNTFLLDCSFRRPELLMVELITNNEMWRSHPSWLVHID
jgi:hypothetical protein